jgi:large subunit ribosomal protein L18
MSITDFVQYRRKREGRTNYKKRLAYLKSGKTRLVIRKTNRQLILQLVDYTPDGDKVICTVTSNALGKLGWKYSYNSLPACYLAGMLIAKKAREKKISGAIADFGLQTNAAGSRLFAAVKGAIDGGLDVPVDEEALPSESRLKGEHILSYYKESSQQQFSGYKSQKHDPAHLAADIEAVKKKIMHD